MTEMRPKSYKEYTCASDVPNCRYIRDSYPEIINLIVDGVKHKVKTEILSPGEEYDNWNALASKFIRYSNVIRKLIFCRFSPVHNSVVLLKGLFF